MRSSLHQCLLLTNITAIAVASAYVNQPYFLIQRAIVRDYQSSSFYSSGLAVSQHVDSTEENWDPYHQSPLLRAQNVAQFCSEIGCTIQAYQGSTDKLKRRKRNLSQQMLIVEDELDRLENGKISQHNTIYSRIFDSVEGHPFSSNLGYLLPKTLQSYIKDTVHSTNLHSDDYIRSHSILSERRKKLSDRALAIQNLLATLEVMEYAGMSTTRELAESYRHVAEEERIDPFSEPSSKIPSWTSFLPQPPRLPPTMKQFMKQCRGDQSSTDAIATSYHDNDANGESKQKWFARKRVSAYPFSTATAASKGHTTNQFRRTTRGIFHPFLGNNNSTSSV